VNNLAQVTDRVQIEEVQAQLSKAIQEVSPPDFQQYLSSDVLPVQAILEEPRRAVAALTLSGLAQGIDRWHERLQASLSVETSGRMLCCGPGAVEDREVEAQALVDQLRACYPEKMRQASYEADGRSPEIAQRIWLICWRFSGKQPASRGRG